MSGVEKEARGWPWARTLAGFVVLATSIAMFLLDGFGLTRGLRDPALLFLGLAAIGLFGMSVHDVLRLIGLAAGAVAAIAQSAAERADRASEGADDDT